MVASVMDAAERPLVTNRAGSNMHWGVATALLDAGRRRGEVGLFEVDEAWLPRVAGELAARIIVLTNLFRDQLDRYGELELVAERWERLIADRSALARPPGLVLNADDPLVADLGRDRSDVSYYGVEDAALARADLDHAADSKSCRGCGAAYVYEAVFLAHLGHYRCVGCGRERPAAAVVATEVTLRGMAGSKIALRTPAGALSIELPLPGLYNVYNALAATATALRLGASLDHVRAGLEGFVSAFGRVERVTIASRELAILLVKNPAGANEVLRTLALEDVQLDLWIALNDGIADGRDVSWIWDADFELLAGRVRRATCSGTRAEEMALRLKYAGFEAPIDVDADLGRSIDAALTQSEGGVLYALPTYTALLDLRRLLSRRGLVASWSDR